MLSNDKTIVLKFAFGIHVHVVMKRDSDEAQEDKGFNFEQLVDFFPLIVNIFDGCQKIKFAITAEQGFQSHRENDE